MITSESPLYQSTKLRLMMTANLVQSMNYHCWENGDDTASDYVAPEQLSELKSLLEQINGNLAEIEAAAQCQSQC